MINDYVLELDNFEKEKKIGEGHFSQVYLIKHKVTHEKYAAKISKEKCIKPNVQKDFYREIESFIIAKYPTILNFIGHNIFDFNLEPYPTVVTEYMPQYSLQKILDDSKKSLAPLDWSATKRYINLIGIALGMKHLHSKNIVHRDLKPSNILLDENYYPKICDFGLSKLFQERVAKMQMETNCGTPFYMAPEIFSGDPYTFKIDIYSFGKIAFEIITNKRSPIQISEIQGDESQKFLKKCLSSNPSERPTFDEICEFIVKKDFVELFGDVDYDEVDYFLDLFADDDDEAAFIHGSFLSEKNDPSNRELAADFFKISAQNGNPKAMLSYANMLKRGDGVEINKVEAAEYYKKSADKGNSNAMLCYANMLKTGDGIEMNKKEAAQYYKKSADEGNSKAMLNYAIMLKHGDGIEINKKEAAQYYKKSADEGNSKAMLNYAIMLDTGDGIEINKKEAAKYYKKSADDGNSKAIFNYAVMLDTGDGVEINKKEAAKYYKKSADDGNSTAMFNYAYMLKTGDGIEINKEEAARYYKKSADKGNKNAMLNYANMLNSGDGIQMNKEEAAQYYKMAEKK